MGTKKIVWAIIVVVAAFAFNSPVYAGGNDVSLTGIDTILTSLNIKSLIAGDIAKNADGYIQPDANGNLNFNFKGVISTMKLDQVTGELCALSDPIGTINGQAAFPPEFANLAFGVYSMMLGGPMPSIPPTIDWTFNDFTLVVADTTYRPISDMSEMIPGTADLLLKGRAFSGLGPVELGQLGEMSMSVRMGGCTAVVAVDGANAGKVGSLCLNGTFTFDLSGIDLDDPFSSDLAGTGNTNCTVVLHTPIM
ncbi:MAG: hypothetical protein OEY01_07630 [Desulfobulbaceae bacterium]|nr:hypothetical protein [Desulfobulbaceae bacterium]HIJ78924.1 hypothetical protein [Deltaproteobacteria bacterium]